MIAIGLLLSHRETQNRIPRAGTHVRLDVIAIGLLLSHRETQNRIPRAGTHVRLDVIAIGLLGRDRDRPVTEPQRHRTGYRAPPSLVRCTERMAHCLLALLSFTVIYCTFKLSTLWSVQKGKNTLIKFLSLPELLRKYLEGDKKTIKIYLLE